MGAEFKVGDLVRPIAARSFIPRDQGRTTIEIISGGPDCPYGHWFHTNGKNPRGPWRDLARYELVPEAEK